jgi:hypothetical protein
VAGVIGLDHPQRKQLETFIARQFRDVHGAHLSVFMPQLLALFDDQGAIRAAVGMRDAGVELSVSQLEGLCVTIHFDLA